jgi:hypothetical protein
MMQNRDQSSDGAGLYLMGWALRGSGWQHHDSRSRVTIQTKEW